MTATKSFLRQPYIVSPIWPVVRSNSRHSACQYNLFLNPLDYFNVSNLISNTHLQLISIKERQLAQSACRRRCRFADLAALTTADLDLARRGSTTVILRVAKSKRSQRLKYTQHRWARTRTR